MIVAANYYLFGEDTDFTAAKVYLVNAKQQLWMELKQNRSIFQFWYSSAGAHGYVTSCSLSFEPCQWSQESDTNDAITIEKSWWTQLWPWYSYIHNHHIPFHIEIARQNRNTKNTFGINYPAYGFCRKVRRRH